MGGSDPRQGLFPSILPGLQEASHQLKARDIIPTKLGFAGRYSSLQYDDGDVRGYSRNGAEEGEEGGSSSTQQSVNPLHELFA